MQEVDNPIYLNQFLTDSSKERARAPSLNFEHIKGTLLSLHENKDGLSRARLSKELGIKVKTLSSILPFLEDLKLITYRDKVKKEYICLTEEGELITNLLNDEDLSNLKKKSLKILFRNAMLGRSYTLIKHNDYYINPENLGNKLREDFNRDWNSHTINNVGRNAINILKGFGLIEGYNEPNDTLLPQLSSKRILKHLDDFSQTGKTSVRVSSFISLGLVVKKNGGYKLTEVGDKLRECFNKGQDTSNIFREVILNHNPSISVIEQLSKMNRFRSEDIAHAIMEYNNQTLSESTQYNYAYTFLSWMREANLIQELRKGEYRIEFTPESEQKTHMVKGGGGVAGGDMPMYAKSEETENSLKNEVDDTIEELKTSEYDIAIIDGKYFLKMEKKVDNDYVVTRTEEVTDELDGKEISPEKVKLGGRTIFIKLKDRY
ncbi:MAG: hypothetical protein R6U44_01365 [Archaeoglobaceae archaeon]